MKNSQVLFYNKTLNYNITEKKMANTCRVWSIHTKGFQKSDPY